MNLEIKVKLNSFRAIAGFHFDERDDFHYRNMDRNAGLVIVRKYPFYSALFFHYREQEFMKVAFLSFPDLAVSGSGEHSVYRKKVPEEDFGFFGENNHPQHFFREVEDFCKKHNLYAVLGYFAMEAALQEPVTEENPLQSGYYLSRGNPPLLIVEKDSIRFPTRAGIPVGIVPLQTDHQLVSIPLHSELYLHSPLETNRMKIKDVYDRLQKNEPEMLSSYLILFRYRLESFG